MGENFVNINGQTMPDSIDSARLHNAYFALAEHIKETVLVQSVFKDIFVGSYYSFTSGDVVMNDTLANLLNRADAAEPADTVQNRAYWGHIGGIVASHADQFSISENQVLAQVNAKAGFTVDYHTLTLTGSAGVDDFDGTTGSDTIFALAGNDSLTGDNGNDSLAGGDGNDAVYGDYGNDTVDGGNGDDSLRGGGDNDLVVGGAGNDSLDGGYGDDTLDGGAGLDLYTGGSGADRFIFTTRSASAQRWSMSRISIRTKTT